MIEQIMITLPLPPKMLNPNRPTHWRTKWKAAKGFKEASMIAVCVEGGRGLKWPRATAEATFYWPDNRRRDIDNAQAMLKPAYDALTLSGLIVDDSSDCLKHLPTVFAIDAKNPRVEVVVTKS